LTFRDETLTSLKEQGLQTFPLRDKRPAVSNWQNYNGDVKEDQSFGIILGGESKIFIIDVDDYSLFSNFTQFLDKTYVVKTGKGFHIFVKANNLPQTIRLNNNQDQHIDIQSTGTYVVGEISKHYDKNTNGNYVETEKIYEKISNDRKINHIDFEEFKLILKKLGFDLVQKPIKKELRESITSGIKEGNRNNSLFKLSCLLLSSGIDSSVVYDEIISINQKSPKPLEVEEIDVLFASATKTVQQEIEENQTKFEIDRDTELELLDGTPQQIRAITLDEAKTRHILVYLPANETDKKTGIKKFVSKAFIISNGINGKQILPLDDPFYQENFFTTLYTEYPSFQIKFYGNLSVIIFN